MQKMPVRGRKNGEKCGEHTGEKRKRRNKNEYFVVLTCKKENLGV